MIRLYVSIALLVILFVAGMQSRREALVFKDLVRCYAYGLLWPLTLPTTVVFLIVLGLRERPTVKLEAPVDSRLEGGASWPQEPLNSMRHRVLN